MSIASVFAMPASAPASTVTASRPAPANAARRPTIRQPAPYVAITAMTSPRTEGSRYAQIARASGLEKVWTAAACSQ